MLHYVTLRWQIGPLYYINKAWHDYNVKEEIILHRTFSMYVSSTKVGHSLLMCFLQMGQTDLFSFHLLMQNLQNVCEQLRVIALMNSSVHMLHCSSFSILSILILFCSSDNETLCEVPSAIVANCNGKAFNENANPDEFVLNTLTSAK